MKTTVEWLVEQMINKLGTRIENTTEGCELFEQAKEMEKKRMVDFAKYCLNNAKYLNFNKALFNVEEYYQIFKSK
jgi:hypothetical protein